MSDDLLLRQRQSADIKVPPLGDDVVLDPGICELVRRLRAHDFLTVDSGDGRTKPEDQRTFGDRAHVVIRVRPTSILVESHRLQALLESWIPTLGESPAWECDASYNPRDGVALLFVWDVLDEMLASERSILQVGQ